MAKLSPDVKRFIVKRLACFDTPAEVRAALKEDFGIEVTYQAVAYYDPTHKASHDLSKDLRELFQATRKFFLANPTDVGTANLPVRLRLLDAMVRNAMARKNYGLAAQLLEQVAKDIGGKFTNVLKVGSNDPLDELAKQLGCTKEQLSEALAQEELGDTSTAAPAEASE